MHHARRSGAWNAWVQLVEQRAMMARTLQLAVHAGAGKAFRRWDEMVSERERLHALASRVARRMMKRVQAAVFDCWYERIHEAISEREGKLRRAIIMMSRRMVAWCLSEWKRKAVGIAERREARMRHILGRIRNRAVVLCVTEWRAYTARARELKQYYAARLASVLRAKVFAAWAATARREAGMRLRMRAMAIRMARRTEVIVLQEWHRYVVEAHSYMNTAMRRWLNERLSAAFEAWADLYAEQVYLQLSLIHI